jgi:uncharacterized protein YndB with AHSA1/START domain
MKPSPTLAILVHWWGPHGFTAPVCEVEARAGGPLNIHMRGPDGTIYPCTGLVHEASPYDRFVFSSALPDPNDTDGALLFETLTTIGFASDDAQTIVTLHSVVVNAKPAAAPSLRGMDAGWNQSLDKLATLLTNV